ncbi:high-affinity branched-chain amino acid ABC transporter permease LivM [Azospirillum sp. RWY-5-1]|uniref:High-affinity branched-chain amino acid ABC transporter permease LivM n=1 Tax=Azospirillum oleiclasticum TaxID=2735135 RepID=A0ABX2T3T1_9PROT|nr:high-affinity branched-chain amino acid ABC transporter permease LivM [Azospirillum oleiclasticum]NYZ11703.1 high-affinity branched-chain amino acid ABC transporter permease LivM [Azospirillum oleiclasticum]NYZ18864.1 high-affinity branched-chain amino acid ABC transporter permease LivM [Azospirillum oleiclasticum]
MTAISESAAGRALPWPSMLRESGLAAFVALLLTVPLVGFRTVDRPTGLGISTRFDEVLAAAALVFIGRLGLCLVNEGRALLVMVLSILALAVSAFVGFPTEALKVIAMGGAFVISLRAAMKINGDAAITLAAVYVALFLGPWLQLGGGVTLWLVAKSVIAAAALAVAVWRGLHAWRKHGAPVSLADRDKAMDRIAVKVQQASRFLGPVGIAFALIFPFLPIADRVSIDIGILLLTYIMLGWGLNIVVGLAGLLDLGYVAFYAVGAYSYALLATYFGWGFWICLPLAGVLAALSGVLLGFPVLRLRGDYFAIVTLGFGEIIRVILINWYQFTGGPNGISGIPRPSFFGLAEFNRNPTGGLPSFHEMFGLEFSSLHRIIFLYYLILALALVVNLFTLRVRKLPMGRAWEALREDDIACSSLGINRTNMKLGAFAIAAMFGGFAGSFFATRQGFISPESFTFIESAIILAIVVLGGMGSQVGVVVATFIVIGLPEMFRELEQYRMVAFGMGMVLIMLWRPRGLLAHRDPTIRLQGYGGGGTPAAGTAAAGGEAIAGGRAK